MQTVTMTKAKTAPETLSVVAETGARAGELVRALTEAGVTAEPAEMEDALAGDAPVVLVCPEGWEESCRRSLTGFRARERCPPAILVAGRDPQVLLRAGPAYGFLPLPLAPRRVVATWSRARQDWEKFSSRWPAPLGEFPATEWKGVASLLERATGIEIRSDRQGPFLHALRSRMVGRLAPTLREYAELACDPAELASLAVLLSVGETYFWRYSGQYLALQALIGTLPVSGRAASPLRVWSAGCATGEEAYSLAMACLEAAGAGVDVEVVGTDLNALFLDAARRGVFRERSLRNLPPTLRAKYLEPAPGGARVIPAVRERVRFETLNLGGGGLVDWAAARGPFHAVFCRNTLIYLSRRASERALEAFCSCLVDGGGLFLGASEAVMNRRPDLEVCRGMGSFYFRKRGRGPRSEVRPAASGREEDGSRWAELWEAGLAALELEDLARAREAFGELLRERIDDARGHLGTALLLANEGRETEAARSLERAAQRAPRLPETQYLGGLLAERRGEEAEALRWYQEALRLDPGFVMAHVNRAWILRRLGRQGCFSEEMSAALAILKSRPPVASWLTGGLGAEGLLSLVSSALDGQTRA